MSANFNPSPAELALVSQIFAQADPQKLGIITGDVAVRIFGGAKLSPTVLGEIWNLADEDNKGWLAKRGVAIAVRLMGWAQKGEKVTDALLGRPGPLPHIDGISQSPVVQHNTGMSMPKSPPPSARFPPLTPQDKAKFAKLFASCGPTNGFLSGEKARDVFVKSRLSVDKLSEIWNLADTQDRGFLDLADFTIGMYLIQATMTGQLSFIPDSLPPGLYEKAGGNPPGGVATHATGGSSSFSPTHTGGFNTSAIKPQYTGQSASILQPQSTGVQYKPPAAGLPLPSRPSVIPPFPAAKNAQPPWDVTAAEKASSDSFFDTLDTQKRGTIEGDVAVPFMLQSNLPEEVLAQVWDLSDINNDGHLTRDGFAVAMHLIQGKLAGKDIPATLPPSLVPPSMRSKASPFAPPPPQPQEPQRDLLWDDTPPPSATAPPTQSILQPQSTGSFGQPSVFSAKPAPPQKAPAPASQDPFGFGGRDLLEDDEETVAAAPPLHDQSAEIGNTQNQLNSTNRSLETAKAERASVEQALANQAAQLSALQTQLSSAKAAYETETRLLSTLQERYSAQTAEIQKTREELIRHESDLSGIRVEKAEVEGAFLRDKEEVRGYQRKMTEAGTEIETLKAQLEKVKKEAKQQKGRLAIAKKQLSTKEAEKAKVEKDLQEATEEARAATAEADAVEAELAKVEPVVQPSAPAAAQAPERAKSPGSDSVSFAAAHSLPTSPDAGSPAASITGKRNNPFERLTGPSGASTPRSQSPFLPFGSPGAPTPPAVTPKAAEAEALPAASDDPFGFSQFDSVAVGAPAEKQEEAKPAELALGDLDLATPKPGAAIASFPAVNRDSGLSTGSGPTSDNEFYSTPPTTAVDGPDRGASPEHLRSIDETTSQFPAVDVDGTGHVPGHFQEDTPTTEETDLGAQLKDLDVDESDSDSDDDDEPLAERRASLNTNGKGPETKTATPAVDSTPAVAPTSFDDAFGSVASQPTSGATTAASSLAQANSFSAPSPFDIPATNGAKPPTEGSAAPTAGGVNDFDEAMGMIPQKGDTTAPADFSFDSAFDDNFDFASAQTAFTPAPASNPSSAFPPPPNGASSAFPPPPTSNGKVDSPLTSAKNDGFDSIFGNGDSKPAPPPAASEQPISFDDAFASSSSAVPAPSATSPPQDHGISFDDAFGGFGAGASDALKLDGNFGSVSSKASGAPESAEAMKPFPVPSSPTSQRNGNGPASPRFDSIRSASPIPREMSPPPRVSSPKGRPSTASSGKESHDKGKEPPHRSSKLSIRLPFGRKKKHSADPPPLPPSQQSQHITPLDEPQGATTPAVEDDVDAVKQLCGMGFSRTQSVAALEKYGYDVQKALNSLLGS
ncbi:hypothetical protein PLICRDRAFT_40530 [Plicaturopsis crispa FD-325 SS-3]|nr:hypothetical protein PLICRDRAFT_40530 [Plicaturopsis crispa FD-325 SS-3]